MKNFEIIYKTAGTYSDSLRVIGTADIIEEISNIETIIKDIGIGFCIECRSNIDPEKLQPPSPGYYYIWRRSREQEKPKGGLVLDYEEEKAKNDNKNKENKKKKEIRNSILEEQGLSKETDAPHKEYSQSAILESMRMGWKSDREIYKWVIQNNSEALKWVKENIGLIKIDRELKKPEVSNSQVFNPASGKGVHASKTKYKAPGEINNKIIDPFYEWMKYRGSHIAMLRYRNKDDFKLFVIEPSEIGPKALALLRTELMSLKLWGGIKLDINAALRLTEELIIHSDVVDKEIRLKGKRPSEVVKGLRIAVFKNMGTAMALINEALLPLPGWFKIENRDDVNSFLDIIKEHIGSYENGKLIPGCVNSIDETHSNNVPILQQYRMWLTTGDKFDLLGFLAQYSTYYMIKKAKKEYVKEFSVDNLTILFIRGYNMREIVEDAGFNNIAKAIRKSTIQSFKNDKTGWKGSGFETQFGLAQEWKQKIKGGKTSFIPFLSDFIQRHNWEAVNKLKTAPTISQEDINSVLNLINKNGIELVGMLLLSYGYARKKNDVEDINKSKEEGN